jgi:hypothetical protein
MQYTFYDIITAVFSLIGFVIIALVTLAYKKKLKIKKLKMNLSNKWLASVSIILILICELTLLYGSVLEPQAISVNAHQIYLNQPPRTVSHAQLTPAELKIAVISDIHAGPYKGAQFLERVVEKTNAQNPDLVFLVGDYIYSDHSQADQLIPLKSLKARFGKYAVLGNHDYDLGKRLTAAEMGQFTNGQSADYVASKLKEAGIRVLRNEKEQLKLNDLTINIIGLEDLWGNTDLSGFEGQLKSINPAQTNILLQHNPDLIQFDEALKSDLIISGHTHGGQIRLPIIGAVPPLPTESGKDYDQGLFDLREILQDNANPNIKAQLFITNGIGEMGPRARLLCEPEIAILQIIF